MYNYNKEYEKIKYGKNNLSRTVPTHRIYTTIVDFKTGNVLESYERSVKKIYAKKGWCKMYQKDFAEALINISNKPLAIKLYMYLMGNGYFKKDGTIKKIKVNEISKVFNVNKSSVYRAIKTLKDEEIIADVLDELRYNPFLTSVSGQSDAELSEAQRIWEEYIGYYNFYKEKK